MMLKQLKLSFVHHNPSCNRTCMWCWREERWCRVWSTKRSKRKTASHL